MSEATTQAFLQTKLRTMDEFASGDVVINDWTVLDASSLNAPYARIETGHDFRQRQDAMDGVRIDWSIPVVIVVRFVDWGTSYTEMGTLRQAILDLFIDGNRAINPGMAHFITEIRNGTQIEPIYDPYIPTEAIAEAEPVFLAQALIFEVEEWDR